MAGSVCVEANQFSATDCSLNDCNCEDGDGVSRQKSDSSDGDYTSVRLYFGNGDE